MGGWILAPIFLPVAVGVCFLLPLGREKVGDGDGKALSRLHILTGIVLALTAVAALLCAWTGDRSFTLLELMDGIPIYFHIDDVGRLFVTVISVVWVLVGFYAFVYMKHEGKERRFFGFYLIVFGVLIALSFAGNLVTMYLFYELMTLTSMPLVLHNGSREAIMAALKYLFYSMCGAYLGLFGIFFLYKYCDTLRFTAGGTLNLTLAAGNTTILMIAVFGMLIGFGAKAGMFPLHAWLPAAHPVAPSPASAVMSGIIAKAGVLAVIRVVYYVVGPDFIRGTWIQTAWMTLTLLTVFMGSMLAFREPVFKKRLAYSTVSQVSYILFGLSALSPTAMEGALLHVVFHAFIKSALFLTAGIFIFQTGKERVEDFRGFGKKMPNTLWCYTFAALALIGIPPTCGFISKWYLAEGALEAGVGVFGWLGPAVLLLSALLTAGYLLPLVTNGFFPKEKAAVETQAGDPPALMLTPLVILAALTVLLGVFPNPLIRFVSGIAASVL
ncbi:MAG: proton-conducting membrane transporter [Clostridiales bacterium]|nr:proton-conducting membrane transporter [Clostridiales bacterium]